MKDPYDVLGVSRDATLDEIKRAFRCLAVTTMYVDRSSVRSQSGKCYTRYLLRESYRENGKVKHRAGLGIEPTRRRALGLALRMLGS